ETDETEDEATRELVADLDLTGAETVARLSDMAPGEDFPTTRPQGSPSSGKGAEPTTQPAKQTERLEESVPATQPKRTVEPVEPQRRNIYRATFHGGVRLEAGEQRIEGARQFSLVFEWDRSQRERFTSRRESKASPETQPTSAPTTRQVDEPTTAPATTQPDKAVLAAASQPTEEEERSLIITWNGPLVVTPIGYTETASSERFRVEAEGDELTLQDAQNSAVCNSLIYVHPRQAGQLTGEDERPVHMKLGDQSQLQCREVRFDLHRRLAQLMGPGAASLGDDGQLMLQEASSTLTAAAEPLAAQNDRITWNEAMLVRFDTEAGLQGSEADENSPPIREAIFRGQVELNRALTDESLRCDKLHVWTESGEKGWFIRKSVATGNVSVRRENDDVTADRVTVEFAESSPAKDSEQLPEEPRAASIVAEGNVCVRRTPVDDEPAVATAQKITAETGPQTALLQGTDKTPSRISQGDKELVGKDIFFDQTRELAHVRGEGFLRFLSDSDLSGQKLDSPRPVHISWTERMDFNGKRNAARFVGNVRFKSGLNAITAKQMTVAFVLSENPERPDMRESDSALALDMREFARRKVAMIIADGDVIVDWRNEDELNRTVQRMRLKGERLVYDDNSGQVDCFNHGQLLVEDYRPPEPAGSDQRPRSADEVSAAVQRPWQTAFEWDKQMQLLLKQRMVIINGDVAMVHVSGNKVNRPQGLSVPEWGELSEGRTVRLGCGKLIARFAPVNKPPGRRRDKQGVTFDPGSRFGPLELFTATRDVTLDDERFGLTGQRLRYNRSHGLAILWGYLEGQQRYNAAVTERDPAVGKRVLKAPKFHCYLEQERLKKIVIAKAVGRGGR
ncbi:MAG: LptA/OstA family protein, partial [Planctomycetota bacterium]